MSNMIIVAKSERWSGLERQLVSYLTLEASERELRLIATPKGLSFYEKLGFQVADRLYNFRA